MAEVYALTNFDDVEAIRDQLIKSNKFVEAQCWFIGCHVGLRAGDLLSLTWDDLRTTEQKVIEMKTGKARQLLLTPVIKECLDFLRVWYKQNHPDLNSNYLFKGTGNRARNLNKPLSPGSLLTSIKEAALDIGVTDNIGTHTMRKTYGYHFYQICDDIKLLQKEFGHANELTTFAYINVTHREIKATKMAMDFRRKA